MQFSTLQLEEMLREKGIDPETLPSKEHDEMLKVLMCNGGGGGVSSWNDLTDKPFEKEIKTYAFDGVLEGKDTIFDGSYVKVSDDVPTAEMMDNLYGYQDGSVMFNGQPMNKMSHFSNETVWHDRMFDGLYICYSTHIVESDGSEHDVPSTGVYIGTGFLSYSFKYEKTKPIDPEFIQLTSPNGTQYKLSVSDDGTLSAVAVS